ESMRAGSIDPGGLVDEYARRATIRSEDPGAGARVGPARGAPAVLESEITRRRHQGHVPPRARLAERLDVAIRVAVRALGRRKVDRRPAPPRTRRTGPALGQDRPPQLAQNTDE